MALEQPQSQVIRMPMGTAGLTQHQHHLFGINGLRDHIAIWAGGPLQRWRGRPLCRVRPYLVCPLLQRVLQRGWPGSADGQHGASCCQLSGHGLELACIQLLQVVAYAERVMAITRAAIHQLPPLIDRQLEGVLPLPLQCLQAQGTFQFQLFSRQMGVSDHPVEQGHQLLGVFARAAQTDQQAVFVGVAAQSGTTPFHQIRQLTVVEGAAAAAEGGRQQLMRTTSADAICGTAPGQQQFRCHHPRGGDAINNQVRDGHQ